jgi:hypothetical protein
MLVAEKPFTLPDFPNVIIYPDDSRIEVFYAIPGRPRVARGDDGNPEASLFVYGKGRGPEFVPAGAILTVTVALELTLEEQAKVKSLLSKKLALEASGPAPTPELVPIHWTDSEVELRVAGTILRQTSSMMGDNRASFSSKLDGTQAKAVEAAWKNGSSEVFVSYQMKTNASTVTSRTDYNSSSRSAKTPDQNWSQDFAQIQSSSTETYPSAIRIEGPLEFSEGELQQRINRVET